MSVFARSVCASFTVALIAGVLLEHPDHQVRDVPVAPEGASRRLEQADRSTTLLGQEERAVVAGEEGSEGLRLSVYAGRPLTRLVHHEASLLVEP